MDKNCVIISHNSSIKFSHMAKRKYLSEFGLNMFGTYKILLQQDQLKSINKFANFSEYPCHIYMVARRPRIIIDPLSVRFKEKFVSGTFKIQKGYNFESHDFTVPNYIGTPKLQFKSPYPHTNYSIFDYGGHLQGRGKVALLVTEFNKFWDLLKLEILYIGQSYGVEGARTAPERLINHSTLQNIYSEAIQKSPDQDIWLLLWSFEPLLIGSFEGRKEFREDIEFVAEEDTAHINKVAQTGITEQQQINFTEAALIRYFQPEYNFTFKDSFPNPAHKTYSECYELDINSVIVELQTEDIKTQIWSNSAPAKWTHYAQYPLHSENERRSMFDMFN